MTDIVKHVEKLVPEAKHVIFDLGDVALTYHKGLEEMSRKLNCSLKEIREFFSKYDDSMCRGDLNPQEFWEKAVSNFGYNGEHLDFLEFWASNIESIKKTHDAMKTLHEKRIPVGILTNIFPGMLKKYLKSGVIPDIPYNPVVESCKVGFVKPDKEIFEYMKKQLSCKPEEILFIDDREDVLEVARKFGWKTLRYETPIK